jgi:primosomal protein N' (replication factor Y)
MPSVLRVALPVPLPTLATFDYLPPASGEAAVGGRVLVPFGRGKAVGVVIEVDVPTTVGSGRLKRVLKVLDEAPLLDAELMQTLAWAATTGLAHRAKPMPMRCPCCCAKTNRCRKPASRSGG